MWPKFVDVDKDTAKGWLRRWELSAYSSVVTALRAQGELTKERRKVLGDLGNVLNVGVERHKTEIRRAVNDEKVASVARVLFGPNTESDWAREGRRIVPLLRRAPPQTAFTPLADKVKAEVEMENVAMQPPIKTKTPRKRALEAGQKAKGLNAAPTPVQELQDEDGNIHPPMMSIPAKPKLRDPNGLGDIVVLPGGKVVRYKEEPVPPEVLAHRQRQQLQEMQKQQQQQQAANTLQQKGKRKRKMMAAAEEEVHRGKIEVLPAGSLASMQGMLPPPPPPPNSKPPTKRSRSRGTRGRGGTAAANAMPRPNFLPQMPSPMSELPPGSSPGFPLPHHPLPPQPQQKMVAVSSSGPMTPGSPMVQLPKTPVAMSPSKTAGSPGGSQTPAPVLRQAFQQHQQQQQQQAFVAATSPQTPTATSPLAPNPLNAQQLQPAQSTQLKQLQQQTTSPQQQQQQPVFTQAQQQHQHQQVFQQQQTATPTTTKAKSGGKASAATANLFAGGVPTTIHLKEAVASAGMKVIPAGAARVLPEPGMATVSAGATAVVQTVSGAGATTPVYMVAASTPGAAGQPNVMRVARAITSAGPRVVTVSTTGATRKAGPMTLTPGQSVRTLQPRSFVTASAAGAAGVLRPMNSPNGPSVVVVQRTPSGGMQTAVKTTMAAGQRFLQTKNGTPLVIVSKPQQQLQQPGSGMVTLSTSLATGHQTAVVTSSGFPLGHQVMTTTMGSAMTTVAGTMSPIKLQQHMAQSVPQQQQVVQAGQQAGAQGGNVIVLNLNQDQLPRSNVLSDILQANGIIPGSSAPGTPSRETEEIIPQPNSESPLVDAAISESAAVPTAASPLSTAPSMVQQQPVVEAAAMPTTQEDAQEPPQLVVAGSPVKEFVANNDSHALVLDDSNHHANSLSVQEEIVETEVVENNFAPMETVPTSASAASLKAQNRSDAVEKSSTDTLVPALPDAASEVDVASSEPAPMASGMPDSNDSGSTS